MLVVKGARASISGNPLAKRIRALTPMEAGLDVGNFGIIRFLLLFSSINKLNIMDTFYEKLPPMTSHHLKLPKKHEMQD